MQEFEKESAKDLDQKSDQFFLDRKSKSSEDVSPSLEATQESALFKSILKGVFDRSKKFILSVKVSSENEK